MDKMKNLIAFFTVTALLLVILTACGGGDETPPPEDPQQATGEATTQAPDPDATREPCGPALSGPLAGIDPRGQTVTWWHALSAAQEQSVSAIVADFNASNRCGITVQIENQDSYADLQNKLSTGIATGEFPALAVGEQTEQARYARASALTDMNPYIADPDWGFTAEELADFHPDFLEQGVHITFGGQRLGFPLHRSMQVLYYNQTWLQELGFEAPPTTPLEFEEMACAAATASADADTDNEHPVGYVLPNDTSATAKAVAAWTLAFGGDIRSEDSTGYVYNGETTESALMMLNRMYDHGCAYFATAESPAAEFAARRALFTQDATIALSEYAAAMETAENNDIWSVAVLPHATADLVQMVDGSDFMIPATEPEAQLAAWIFLKWFSDPARQVQWDQISASLPTRDSTLTELNVEAFPEPWSKSLSWLSNVAYEPHVAYEPQFISYPRVREGFNVSSAAPPCITRLKACSTASRTRGYEMNCGS
jgi:multiple sugar transport system substrate-binding protein/sn-glycerol 3-phosphate transport system substrate-binding protein